MNFTTAGSTTAGSTDYTATCIVTTAGATGTPSITWKNPDDTVISTGSNFTVGDVTGSDSTYSMELMFKSLKTSQAGVYTCSATLDLETSKSTMPVNVIGTLNIRYQVHPVSELLYIPLAVPPPSGDVTANLDLHRSFYDGHTVTLTCTIKLDPAVDSVVAVMVSWAGPDGKMLSTGDRVTVSDVTGSGPYQSTLTLSSLITSDTGVYTCTASAGSDASIAHLVASEDVADSHTITAGMSSNIGT